MKRIIRLVTKQFSGLLSLIIVGGIAYILSGDLGGLLKWLWTFNWLVIPLAVMLILVPFWPSIKGAIGEYNVRKKLSRLDPSQYKIHNNILLKLFDGKTSQIDHIVVSVYGVFVIETKNYSGWISGDDNREYWTQTFFKSKKRFLNPVWQNNGHVKALNEVLGGIGEVRLIPVVVFSNKANLKHVTSDKVISISGLTEYIKAWNERILDENRTTLINARLQQVLIRDRKEMKMHIEGIKNKVEEKARICPKCGSPLVQRNGRYGSFIGCSGYPKCRYIYKGQ